MAFFLLGSQRSAGFPGNETAIQAGPGTENKVGPIATFHAQNTLQLGHTCSGCVCQPLGPGLPGGCIDCFEHEVIYGVTKPDFGLVLVVVS